MLILSITMLNYNLPIHKNALECKHFLFENSETVYIVSHTLHEYLLKYKKQIAEHSNEWDNMKRITNPYEFIHSHVPNGRSAVAKTKPLSRSFFKMIEMCRDYNLCGGSRPITTFHLAEGPGGFIEATAHMRQNESDIYYGMTLIDDFDPNIPSWKKTSEFLAKTPNVRIEYGPSKNGDLFSVENLQHCYHTYRNKMDIITADGGFDFSENFNEQESLATKLLLAEVIYALAMQKIGGCFILKVFDITTKTSIDILYLLTCFYEEVSVCKPKTSRIANSEKYIVCKGFQKVHNYEQIMGVFITNYKSIMNQKNISSLIRKEHNYLFINKIEEINAIFGQTQIENIAYTIGLIVNRNKYDRVEQLKKNHLQKCTEWCNKYNIPNDGFSESDNIFLQRKKEAWT